MGSGLIVDYSFIQALAGKKGWPQYSYRYILYCVQMACALRDTRHSLHALPPSNPDMQQGPMALPNIWSF